MLTMGSGASADMSAAVQSASAEELRAFVAGLEAPQRSKLQHLLSQDECVHTVFLCGQDRAPLPVPLLDRVLTGMAASGSHFTVVQCKDGTLWMLRDGCEQAVEWQLLTSKCGNLRSLSVHDCMVIGIADDDKCMGYPTPMVEDETWTAFGVSNKILEDMQSCEDLSDFPPVELPLLGGRGVVELVGHSPELWIIGRGADGRIWAFGKQAGPEGGEQEEEQGCFACEIELPGPCDRVSVGREHGLALLKDGRVFTFGAGTEQYHTASHKRNSNGGIVATHVVELDGQGIIGISAGMQHSAALSGKDGSIYTWGTSKLFENGVFSESNTNYLGQLWRPTESSDETMDKDIEYGPAPGKVQLPAEFAKGTVNGLMTNPVGETYLTFSDGRVLRLALGASLKAGDGVWCKPDAMVTVHPQRYNFTVCANVPISHLVAAIDEELAAFSEAIAKSQVKKQTADLIASAAPSELLPALRMLLEASTTAFSWRGLGIDASCYWSKSLENLLKFRGRDNNLAADWAALAQDVQELQEKISELEPDEEDDGS